MVKNIIQSFFPKLIKTDSKKMSVAWIVHPRNISDVQKQLPFLRFLPKSVTSVLVKNIPPYIISKIKKDGNALGYVIACPILPEDFKKNEDFALKKVERSLELAKKLGIKKISVGGFINTAVKKQSLDTKLALSIYDGSHLLSHLISEKVEAIIRRIGDNRTLSVAIIGATTASGKLISKSISTIPEIDRLFLTGRTMSNLQELKKTCEKNLNESKIELSTDNSIVKYSDIVILTAFIPEDDKIVDNLKAFSYFISAIEPTSPFVYEIAKSRDDVFLEKQVTVKTPSLDAGIKTGLAKTESFVCLCDAFVNSNEKTYLDTKKTLERLDFKIS